MTFNSKRSGIILTLHRQVHGEVIARSIEAGRQNENGELQIWLDFRHAKTFITCSTGKNVKLELVKSIIKNNQHHCYLYLYP